MPRPIQIFIITLFLTACKTNSQNKIDVPKSIRLFKEGADLLKQGFTLEYIDSLGGQNYYRQSIDKFKEAYGSDTTNIQLGTYLSDLYSKTQQFDSALIWALRMFPFDSTTYYKDNSISISHSYSFIGSCYLYEGDITNGEKYFRLAINADSHQVGNMAHTLSDIADKFYNGTLPNQIQKLKIKNISPCKYSLDIMKLGLSIGETEKFVKEYIFTNEIFTEREKNCR
jgi:tetratricopeptide (TPR) repeat protein